MKSVSLSARMLAIPFKAAFKHAAAARDTGSSLWVQVRDPAGHTGHGEGCPRPYVTGETPEGALAFVQQHRQAWLASIHDLASLKAWAQSHVALIDANPAAWCAVELALLDLFARQQTLPVERLLGLPGLAGEFRYTAVLGDAAPEAFATQLARYRAAGFEDFKLKLSGDAARDRTRLATLDAAGVDPMRVRADANNLWREPDAVLAHLDALAYPLRMLEEPLAAADFAGLRRLAQRWPGCLVLDESLLRAGQLDALAADPGCWVLNLRVSKQGGLLRALELLRGARRLGIPVVVGAQVGETSLLTRAALPLAQAARGGLLGQEGACGTHLLARDVTETPLMFGAGGRLAAAAAHPDSAGWGVEVSAPEARA